MYLLLVASLFAYILACAGNPIIGMSSGGGF
jgi:hypothetical protein